MADLGSLETKTGAGEFGTMSMRVEGVEISVWKSYSYNSHYLTPSDQWRFEVGDEEITPELRKLLIPGNRVEFFIDDVKQASGFIDSVDIHVDRNGGLELHIEGRDTMSPLVDSQIDPNKKFPEKTRLDKLVKDTVADFGFVTVSVENDVALRLGKKVQQKHRKKHPDRFLADFPVPKKKPQHNDTYFQFLSRVAQRYGFWVSSTINGDGLIVGKPNYDQDPSYQARRKRAGADNNILHGGIRRDGSDQPSFIIARGDIPGRSVEHKRTRVIIDNPYVAGLELGLSMQEQSEHPGAPVGGDILDKADPAFVNPGSILDRQDVVLGRNHVVTDPATGLPTSASIHEYQTFVTVQQRVHEEVVAGSQYTTIIPVQPLKLPNSYATKISRPRYIKDTNSHTLEELTNFAKREMSLCTRKAFVAHYDFMGHKLNDNIIQVDTIIDIDDEAAAYQGQLWILSRTFQLSRNGGCTTSIEAIPINALQF